MCMNSYTYGYLISYALPLANEVADLGLSAFHEKQVDGLLQQFLDGRVVLAASILS